MSSLVVVTAALALFVVAVVVAFAIQAQIVAALTELLPW